MPAPWRHDWLWGADASPPPQAGRLAGQGLTALVMGSGHTLWDDLHRLRHVAFDRVFAVNHALILTRCRVHGLATLETALVPHFLGLAGLGDGPERPGRYLPAHSHRPGPGVTQTWAFARMKGGSGLFALSVALAMGIERVALAGMPYDGRYLWEDPRMPPVWNYDNEPDSARRQWRECALSFPDQVRSLSGRTRDWFGDFTDDWLQQET